MNILLCCRLRVQTMRTAKELLESRGHRCALVAWESASYLRARLHEGGFDTLLCAETSVLPHRALPVRTVYLAPDFYCAQRFPSGCVSLCLIAHEQLSFDFITHGVQDKAVRVCGVPLPQAYRTALPRVDSCRMLGLRETQPVYLAIGDTVSLTVLKSFVSAVQSFCPTAQILLLGSGEVRRSGWMRAFTAHENVYVSDLQSSFPLGLSACDAVFTPAYPAFVCAAAVHEKPVALLHTASARAVKNAAFLSGTDAAFLGKSTADGVSYICRLLDSDRLRANMIRAQRKLIVPDAQTRFLDHMEA